MMTNSTEKQLSRIIAYGASFTTIFIVSGSVTDPVNVPKFLSLGIVSTAALGIILGHSFRSQFKNGKFIWGASTLFLLFGLISVLSGKSPFSQEMYGSYGRNNGFLTYLFLVLILLASSNLHHLSSYRRLIYGFFFAGLVNVVYCFWVIIFGDFISWSNPYGNILGTFGNPNFIGAFLGMFLAAYLGYGLSVSSSKYFKFSMLFILPITAFEIIDSHAIQGRVVGAGGIAIVGFFYLRSKFNSLTLLIYSSLSIVVGFVALLGAFQIGPLTSIIYKTSVSLRGQYWLAGWNAGQSHPFTGIGMDSLGDWYRRSRDIHALELPGVNVVVNASHNVPVDMFAFGGWPLFLTYVTIMAMGGLALFKAIRRTKEFDPILVVITTAWVGYQVQSIISINQIGLAIWGWTMTGAAIAYERTSRTITEAETSPRKKMADDSFQDSKTILSASIWGLVGLILAIPPLIADSRWRSAQVSRSVQAVEATMIPSYFNPQNSMKYFSNIQDLEQSNLPDLAHKYALEAVNWNSNSFDLWKILFLIRNSTSEEKKSAVANMNRLDPLNPDVTATNQ